MLANKVSLTLKSSFVFFQFHPRDDLRCYLCRLLFCFCFRYRCSFPLYLIPLVMKKFLGLDLKKGKICSPCYYTPTTFIIKLLGFWTHFNPLNLVCINDIDSLTIPGIHEVPHAEVLQYINSILV